MSVRTIGTEIVLSGEKQFNDAMKSVNSGLKTTKTEMALVSAEFADNADSVEALTAKQKLLQSSVDQHRAKVDALREMYEHQKKQYGENSAAADKYKQQLNQATVALLKEESALKKTSSALDEAEAKSGKLAKAKELIKKVNPVRQIKNAADGYKGLVERLAEAQEKSEQFAEKQKKAGEAIKRVTKPLTALPSLAGKAAVGFTKLGAAGVAGLAAVSSAALVVMTNMAKEAAEAAKAAHEAGEPLTDSQQQWLEYSNKLDGLDSSVANAKSALAGVLLPVLGDLSTTGAAFLNDFANDMTAAAGDTEKQSQVLTSYIQKGVQLIKDELPKYLGLGKDLVSSLLKGIGETGPDLLDMGLDLVMDLLDLIFEFAPQLADMGMVLIQKLIEGLIDRGPDLLESAVDMVTKIVLGLAQAAPELIPMAGKLIMMLVSGLLENLPELLAAGLELIKGIITGILNGFGDLESTGGDLLDTLKEALKESIEIFLDIGSEIVQLITDGISEAWDGLVNWFDSLWDGLFKNRKVDVEVNGNSSRVDGSHATGLSYVPFDGYLARLHKGEAVLTASEAAAYRSGESRGEAKTVNMTINTQSLSKDDMDSVVAYVNRKLGEDF